MGGFGGDAHVQIGNQASPVNVMIDQDSSGMFGRKLKAIDFVLRLTAFTFCVAVLILLKTNEQTTVVIPGLIYLKAKYDNTKAPVALLVMTSICCGYSFVLGIISLFCFIRRKTISDNVYVAWSIFVFDQLLTYLILGAAAATAEAAYIAKKGEDKVQWKPVCGTFKKFCDHFAATVFISFLAVTAFALSSVISAHCLFKRKSSSSTGFK